MMLKDRILKDYEKEVEILLETWNQGFHIKDCMFSFIWR